MRPAPAGLSRQEWGLPTARGGPVPHVTTPVPCPHRPRVPAGAPGAGMEADGALDPAALERELRAAVAADERRERENEAKLRAVRQRVPSYEEFRSGGGRPGRGGDGVFGCFPAPNGLRRHCHQSFARCRALLPRRPPNITGGFWSSFFWSSNFGTS